MKLPPRLSLARTPTPIHKLERFSQRLGLNIWIWRDDLTGFVESGNKIRKLEFLLAEALASGATEIITCGGPQSNHARATVCLARRLGLKATVVVREPLEGRPTNLNTGNHLVMRMAKANIRWVPFQTYREAGSSYDSFLRVAADEAQSQGETPYCIAEGGSSPLGTMGYIHGVEELRATWESLGHRRQPDQLVCALGSGGTHAGLVLGYAQIGWQSDAVLAVNVCDDKDYFQKRVGRLIADTVERFALKEPAGALQICDGYVGQGYAQASDEDLLFYSQMVADEGLWLDPVYTGKAFRGMLAEIEKDRGRFGANVVFLHSGGQLANFAFASRYDALLAR